MGTSATAKSKIYIGSTTYATGSNPTLAITDFSSDTFTEIKNISDLGSFGDTVTQIKYETVDSGRVFKLNGTRDAGDLSLVVNRDAADPGQNAARAAAKADFNHSFKIVANDVPDGATGTPTTFYFRGLVQGTESKFSGPNNIVTQTLKIAINSEILEVAATITAGA